MPRFAALLVLATLGKLTGAYAGARLSGLSRWERVALGAGLNARGVIEVVVATVGLRLGVLSMAMYTIIILVAVFTSVMAPPLLQRAMSHVGESAGERRREAELVDWAAPDTTCCAAVDAWSRPTSVDVLTMVGSKIEVDLANRFWERHLVGWGSENAHTTTEHDSPQAPAPPIRGV